MYKKRLNPSNFQIAQARRVISYLFLSSTPQCDKNLCEWLLGWNTQRPRAAYEHIAEIAAPDGHHCVRGTHYIVGCNSSSARWYAVTDIQWSVNTILG